MRLRMTYVRNEVHLYVTYRRAVQDDGHAHRPLPLGPSA
jgi:hypothetical protein